MAQRRVLPAIYFFTAVAAMIALHYLSPGVRGIHGLWCYAGILLIAAGAAIAIHVVGLFRKHATTIRPFEGSSALVTEGPFRYSRNPIYVGMLLMLAGVAVLLGSLRSLLVLPMFFWIITTRVIVVEESMLEQRFGQQYADYKRRVRRWL